jgi:hypothetical protein
MAFPIGLALGALSLLQRPKRAAQKSYNYAPVQDAAYESAVGDRRAMVKDYIAKLTGKDTAEEDFAYQQDRASGDLGVTQSIARTGAELARRSPGGQVGSDLTGSLQGAGEMSRATQAAALIRRAKARRQERLGNTRMALDVQNQEVNRERQVMASEQSRQDRQRLTQMQLDAQEEARRRSERNQMLAQLGALAGQAGARL